MGSFHFLGFGFISMRSSKDILRNRAHFPFRSSLEHQLKSATCLGYISTCIITTKLGSPFRCVPQNRYFAESGVPFRSAEYRHLVAGGIMQSRNRIIIDLAKLVDSISYIILYSPGFSSVPNNHGMSTSPPLKAARISVYGDTVYLLTYV